MHLTLLRSQWVRGEMGWGLEQIYQVPWKQISKYDSHGLSMMNAPSNSWGQLFYSAINTKPGYLGLWFWIHCLGWTWTWMDLWILWNFMIKNQQSESRGVSTYNDTIPVTQGLAIIMSKKPSKPSTSKKWARNISWPSFIPFNYTYLPHKPDEWCLQIIQILHVLIFR